MKTWFNGETVLMRRCVLDAEGNVIAEVHSSDQDADLIAASPRMMRACEAALEIFENKIDQNQNFYRSKICDELKETLNQVRGIK